MQYATGPQLRRACHKHKTNFLAAREHGQNLHPHMGIAVHCTRMLRLLATPNCEQQLFKMSEDFYHVKPF